MRENGKSFRSNGKGDLRSDGHLAVDGGTALSHADGASLPGQDALHLHHVAGDHLALEAGVVDPAQKGQLACTAELTFAISE